MVDSIGSSGQIQNIVPANKSTKSSGTGQSKTAESSTIDRIALSEEALTLAEIEKTLKETAQQLSNDKSETLSNDKKRLAGLA